MSNTFFFMILKFDEYKQKYQKETKAYTRKAKKKSTLIYMLQSNCLINKK